MTEPTRTEIEELGRLWQAILDQQPGFITGSVPSEVHVRILRGDYDESEAAEAAASSVGDSLREAFKRSPDVCRLALRLMDRVEELERKTK